MMFMLISHKINSICVKALDVKFNMVYNCQHIETMIEQVNTHY